MYDAVSVVDASATVMQALIGPEQNVSGLIVASALLWLVTLALLVVWYFRTRAAHLRECQEQREYFENTFRGIEDAVIVLNAREYVTELNPAAERLTGWSARDAHGTPLREVLLTRRPRHHAATDDDTQLLVITARDGSERLVRERRPAIRNRAQEVIGTVVILADVTAHQEERDRRAHSDDRLRSALRAARMLTWDLDLRSNPDAPFLSMSENAVDVLGLHVDHRVTALPSALALCHPDDLARVRQALAAATSHGTPIDLECRVMRPVDGEVRWMYLCGDVLHEEGVPARIVGMALDVTARKLAEDALPESEARFRAMADSAPVLIWESDATGAFSYFNTQWYTFVGGDASRPSDMAALVFDEDIESFRRMMRDLPHARAAATLEFRLKRNDGLFRWMMCTASPRLSGGVFVGGIGSMLDIEERKRLEDDLRVLAADLSAADRRKDEFLATLAHELRNPLAPLRNGLEIMRLALPTGDGIERTRGMMERQVVQIVRLVDDLMDVSRISSGKMSLRLERMDLGTALQSAIEASSASFSAQRQHLTVERPETPAWVTGDLARLSQVFANLLDNASKYSAPGGLVWLSLHQDADHVEIRIRDRGQGIPAMMLRDIFEMFTQVDRSLERHQGGLGIGLTLVKRLVEMHGGTVQARSDGLQHGSEFTVRLPLASPLGASTTAPVPSGVAGVLRQRVLIADDNVDGAETLAMMMSSRGHDVHVAHDGLAAIAIANAKHPTIVLLDIGMPGLNGYEVCQRLRATEWSAHTTMVAITGWGQDDDRRRSAAVGFDHHLVKPVDPVDLDTLLTQGRRAGSASHSTVPVP